MEPANGMTMYRTLGLWPASGHAQVSHRDPIMPAAPVTTLAVPVPADRAAALDALAQARHTDAATLMNEALAQYLDDQAGWAAHLDAGLREAAAGEFADEAAVAAAFRPRAPKA